jgi:hypothetical protein
MHKSVIALLAAGLFLVALYLALQPPQQLHNNHNSPSRGDDAHRENYNFQTTPRQATTTSAQVTQTAATSTA